MGVVTGETIIGANVFKDFLAGMRDFFGGRSGSYEKVLREAKDTSLREMEERARNIGANAIVGIDIDYETIGEGNPAVVGVVACIPVCRGLSGGGAVACRHRGLAVFANPAECQSVGVVGDEQRA